MPSWDQGPRPDYSSTFGSWGLCLLFVVSVYSSLWCLFPCAFSDLFLLVKDFFYFKITLKIPPFPLTLQNFSMWNVPTAYLILVGYKTSNTPVVQ